MRLLVMAPPASSMSPLRTVEGSPVPACLPLTEPASPDRAKIPSRHVSPVASPVSPQLLVSPLASPVAALRPSSSLSSASSPLLLLFPRPSASLPSLIPKHPTPLTSRSFIFCPLARACPCPGDALSSPRRRTQLRYPACPSRPLPCSLATTPRPSTRAAALVDPWSPGAGVDSQSIASSLFAASLLPYLAFLFFLHRSNSAPRLTLFGFYFLLAFVGATIPAGIYAKVHYGTSLSNVDYLHGSAESLLTLTNLLIVLGLREALKKEEQQQQPEPDAQPPVNGADFLLTLTKQPDPDAPPLKDADPLPNPTKQPAAATLKGLPKSSFPASTGSQEEPPV